MRWATAGLSSESVEAENAGFWGFAKHGRHVEKAIWNVSDHEKVVAIARGAISM